VTFGKQHDTNGRGREVGLRC